MTAAEDRNNSGWAETSGSSKTDFSLEARPAQEQDSDQSKALAFNLKLKLLQPIGMRLVEAGLLSPAQVEVTLRDQQDYPDLQFGEILLLRGWICEETLSFFLNLESVCSEEFRKLPLGQRLKTAGLVTEDEIQRAIDKLNLPNLTIGQVLVLQGVISQRTADYFAQLG